MRQGQSLLEVLVATAVGAIMIIAAVTLIAPALKSNTDVIHVQTSAALGRELMDNLRVYSESDWLNIMNLATGTANKYFLAVGSSPFRAVTGTETITADGVRTGLAAWWRFEEATGTVTYDHGPGRYDMTFYNSSTWSAGRLQDNAMSFDGQLAQGVASGSGAPLRYQGGDMTVAFWFKADPADDASYLVSKPWNNTGVYNYHVTDNGGANPTLTFTLQGATSYALSTNNTVTAGAWHHFAVSIASSSKAVKIYLDGKPNRTGTHAIASWTPTGGDQSANLTVGCIYPYASNFCAGTTTADYKGALDDLRIYTRVLTDDEIQMMYASDGYRRYFYVDDVSRNGSGNIAPGSYDPSTKLVTVGYGWYGMPVSSTISTYLTRFGSRAFLQSDWSAGAVTTTPTTTGPNGFVTSSNLIYNATSGSVFVDLPD